MKGVRDRTTEICDQNEILKFVKVKELDSPLDTDHAEQQ